MNTTRFIRIGIPLLTLFIIAAFRPLLADYNYDAYFNGVLANSTVVGAGGAYRAAVDSISMVELNPVALSEIPSWYSLSFTYGSIEQQFNRLSPELSSQQKDIAYLSFGAGFKKSNWKNFGFGIFVTAPAAYKLKGKANSNLGQISDIEFNHQVSELIIPLSFQPTKHWTVGLSPKLFTSSIEFSADGASDETSGTGYGLDFGLLYKRSPNLSLSFTYHLAERSRLKLKESSLVNFDAFRATKSPRRFFIGSSWRFHPQWRANLDFGLVMPMNNTILPGSGISSSTPAVSSGTTVSFQYFAGLEYEYTPGKLHLRLGNYIQPARTDGEKFRAHITGGLDFYFWYLELSPYFDFANSKYRNLGFSISISVSHREKYRTFINSQHKAQTVTDQPREINQTSEDPTNHRNPFF